MGEVKRPYRPETLRKESSILGNYGKRVPRLNAPQRMWPRLPRMQKAQSSRGCRGESGDNTPQAATMEAKGHGQASRTRHDTARNGFDSRLWHPTATGKRPRKYAHRAGLAMLGLCAPLGGKQADFITPAAGQGQHGTRHLNTSSSTMQQIISLKMQGASLEDFLTNCETTAKSVVKTCR